MNFDFTKEPGKKLLNKPMNTKGKKLVSIITPFYNAGKYFEQTFNCVINQTFPFFEWIIVDDGSTDENSIKILEDFSQRDERIKVFHKDNGGPASARNLAIKNSSTEIIIPLDADDLIEPTFIEILYFALKFNPDYDWAYSNSLGFQNQEYTWDKPFDAKLLTVYNFLTATSAIRKKSLEDVGFYDEIIKYYNEDWRLWLKFLSAHKKPVKTKNFGFWYRRTYTGVLSNVRKNPKTAKLAKKLIEEVAATADTSVKAKEYPIAKMNVYKNPVCSDFEQKVFCKHEKIHVLMIFPWLRHGGAGKFNLDICERLDKNKFEIGIITTVLAEHNWQQKFPEHVTDIFNLPEFLDIADWPEFISYYIKSREIDAIFISNSEYGYYLAPYIRKEFPNVAIIDYVHMEEWYWRNGGHARTSGGLGEILEKTYVCNEQTRKVMINNFNRLPESVETLYIGTDSDFFSADKVEAGVAKKSLGIADERNMILFPCRIEHQKRPFLMIEIAKTLKKKIPDIAFAVVGSGSQLDEIKNTVHKNGLENTIYFAGFQDDMRIWYKDAALTLICSLKEGLALTAYESLSMGKPVVTSDVGGQAELINDSVGHVVPLLQSEEKDFDNQNFFEEEINLYVDAIADLLSDSERYGKICASCRERIEEKFATDLMVKKLENIFIDFVKDPEKMKKRQKISQDLRQYPKLVDQISVLMSERASADQLWKITHTASNSDKSPSPATKDETYELMRIANSKWGRRLIKLFFKLKLNRFFK